MDLVNPTRRLPAYCRGARWPLSATGRLSPVGAHQMWTVLLVSVFLVVTIVPHFGMLWHTHDGGYTSHQHANLTALSASRRLAHSPRHHHAYHQGAQALPFGGYYAHPASQPVPHLSEEDASAQFYYVVRTQTDLHWHLYDASLPSLAMVILSFGLVLYAWLLRTSSSLSFRSKRLPRCQPRAPPVC